ncbi:MAG: acyltransferase, partial [Deltaproteobacteria bacterium]|nr:acyltransferase [Deltaproteobacteria bacterium]
MPSKKDASIETLRGIAILMMVAGHVIGHDVHAGMRVADDSTWRYVYSSFEYVRLPLFTCISGFVYALHPVTAQNFRAFLVGKAHRVLLPLFFVGTLQFLLRG